MADARENGVHFIAGGHYATERSAVRRLGELVAERFGVEHRFVDIPNPIWWSPASDRPARYPPEYVPQKRRRGEGIWRST